MKNITFFLTILFFMGYSSRVWAADGYHYTPYAGVDYTFSDTKAAGYSPAYQVGTVRIGSDYSRFFGTEMFFSQSGNVKKHPAHKKIKTSYRSYGLDMLAYLPLGCEQRFSLLATTGIGEYVFKQKFFPAKHHNEHGYGYRFGAGFKYRFDAHWQGRFVARYVKFDHVDGVNHAMEYALGVEYHF